MSLKRFKLILFTTLFVSTVFAQKTKTVEATYTYHVPKSVTEELAEQIALERAMLQALADEFGSIVFQMNTASIAGSDGESELDFSSIGGSEVKGEWIETIGKPEYSKYYDNGMFIITCHVKGKAREIVNTPIDIQTRVLCNGTDDKFVNDRFKDGDDLYISFQSPVAGYIAIYMVNQNEEVAYCLLPYRNQAEGVYPVEANRRYLFFNRKFAPENERHYVDEYVMGCLHSPEYNRIYIFFSPNKFSKATDLQTESSSSRKIKKELKKKGILADSLPRQLSIEDFNKWQVKCRKHDREMNLRMIPISIHK